MMGRIGLGLIVAIGALVLTGATGKGAKFKVEESLIKEKLESVEKDAELQVAIFAGGCFWCTEAVYQRIKGVEKVVSGYIGGTTLNPTYQQICTGTTGHAEAIQVSFDPEVVSFEQLLDVFWISHDPTTLNRQGADVGTQYRSAIFYVDDAQKEAAEQSMAAANEAELYDAPIVTEIAKASVFYPAEKYHQNYFNDNQRQGYCQIVIWPKLKKLGLPIDLDPDPAP